MKIAIFTLNGYENHGNRLQNYAIEKVLSHYGEVNTIFQHSKNYSLDKNNFLNVYTKYKDLSLSEIYLKIKGEIPIKDYADSKIRRFLNFKKFSEQNLNEVHSLINNDKVIGKELSNEYDIFVVGSDQVWNPTWQEGNFYNLLPFETSRKKISIAASFGINDLGTQREWYKTLLKNFDYITVRENKGIDILNEMNISSEVCLDPTLLITINEWKLQMVEIEEKKKYIMLYFLGELPNELNEILEMVSGILNYKIINFNNFRESYYYSLDPFHFISYINSAELVLTDSYHGVVFSNIFNTPYVIFERESNLPKMNSRMETLDIYFEINHRYYLNLKNENRINIDELFQCEFSSFNKNIENCRLKSLLTIERMMRGKLE